MSLYLLKPIRERRESQPQKTSDGPVYINCNATTGVHHTVVCDCGKEIRFQCRFLSPSSGKYVCDNRLLKIFVSMSVWYSNRWIATVLYLSWYSTYFHVDMSSHRHRRL